MRTPIFDFLKAYREKDTVRLHMPGHKGCLMQEDITEIEGADSLYAPFGIIAESEENASRLFGGPTLYSTEGASQCIRAMVYLTALYARENGKKPHILAGRNAHRAFLTAVALADADVSFFGGEDTSYLSAQMSPEAIDKALSKKSYTALYITSPDYLGNCADIAALSKVCRKYGVLLLVDNAHGAYFRFLPKACHPLSLGADLSCSSAHKTLPVLTGGAYLHISETAPHIFRKEAKRAMAMFGSTSPSYLILSSLDKANAVLSDPAYRATLQKMAAHVEMLKKSLFEQGFSLVGNEPLKITLRTKPYGYRGEEVAAYLAEKNIISEFHDPDFIVFMITPETGARGLFTLQTALSALPKKTEITEVPPQFKDGEQVMTVREAAFSPSEEVPIEESVGRILADDAVGCPPAVPIVLCGQRITQNAVEAFRYYGIQHCRVVKNTYKF